MIKLLFLIIFLFTGSYSLRADQGVGEDQDFMNELGSIKNPFEDGLPKPVIIIPKPVYHHVRPRRKLKPKPIIMPKPKPAPAQIVLPELSLQGVMVGDDMHEAIINDQIVPLQGSIEGAQVISVTKQGVELSYKGKKIFLKVD